jgi:hypothetical protein
MTLSFLIQLRKGKNDGQTIGFLILHNAAEKKLNTHL